MSSLESAVLMLDQRDEARAEVARLKAVIATHTNAHGALCTVIGERDELKAKLAAIHELSKEVQS